MFFLQTPEVESFEVWSPMPERFRRAKRSDWADANRGGAVADSFWKGRCSTAMATST